MVTIFSLFLLERRITLPLSRSEPESRQGMAFINQTCGVWRDCSPSLPPPLQTSITALPQWEALGFMKEMQVSMGSLILPRSGQKLWGEKRKGKGPYIGSFFLFPKVLTGQRSLHPLPLSLSHTKMIRRKNKAGWKWPSIISLTTFSAFSGSCLWEGIE